MNKLVFLNEKNFFAFVACVMLTGHLLSQSSAQPIHQWHHQDPGSGELGVSSYKAYSELLAGKTPTQIVVAVIDSGTETAHPDLGKNIWVNEDEIAGNEKDDDGNGYVDDIHGWSFIGGPGGNVEHDNLEFTRVYKELRTKYYGRSKTEIGKAEVEEFERYERMNTEYQSRIGKATEEKIQMEQVLQFQQLAISTIQQALGKDEFTLEEVKGLNADDDFMKAVKEFMISSLEQDFASDFKEWANHVNNQFDYSYNLDFDPRHLVGDNYNDVNEKFYGNNHIDGPKAEHGTHVAGIIGALNNNEGVDGIAQDVKLMIIRCVPDGDERDKDVANAIRYAADNGARIINMSFGKSYSPQKDAVDAAVKHAESKNVLLIHAAGNDGKNIDKSKSFPNDNFSDKTKSAVWLEVGASGVSKEELAADFSNYGKKNVDVFAPGAGIYSTFIGATYKKQSGTSMAAPVAAGVAAAVLSYYPNLTAAELKTILMKSATNYKKVTVILPGSNEPLADGTTRPKKIKFGKLSRSGGVVNLYNALKWAEKLSK
ncbi:MAG: S8 family serine peptidase [Flavobacteriales bacterium]|nr:S8 family serine peptidase [Flavobacteriales bacterium]